MGYYMSVDGGGTKIIAILFDENFKLLGCGVDASVNTNFNTPENYQRAQSIMERCLSKCLENHKSIEIEKLYIAMPAPHNLFVESLKPMAKVGEVISYSEGKMALLAGIQKTKGLVALAGTGSGVFWIDDDKTRHIGGWGIVLGDQGSGYTIGREGAAAAIQAHDGWGPKTLIYDILMEQWNLKSLYAIMPMVYESDSYNTVIASIAPIVSMAAEAGDTVAKEILAKAGRDMALKSLALIRRVKPPEVFDITLAGGVWKGHRIMYDTFCDIILKSHPLAKISRPLFDQVMGGVIKTAMDSNIVIDQVFLDKLKEEFAQFLYDGRAGP